MTEVLFDRCGQVKGSAAPELASDDQIKEAADKLSKLVMTRLGLGANGYKSDALKNWITAQQKGNLSWNQVSQEGDALLEKLYPEPRARSEVQANVRLALLDPDTFEGEVQSFLAPWQQELDKRLAAVKDAGEQFLSQQPQNAVSAARARLNYINASREKFFDSNRDVGLLVFLKGDADKRLDLLKQLQDRKDQDEKERDGMRLDELNVDASTTDIQLAQNAVTQAEDNVKKADDFLSKSKIEVEEATLQTKVNDLAEQQAEDTSAAQAEAEKSAAEKVKASVDQFQGTPTSGTTVLRLEEVNALPIESPLELTVLHTFFE